MSYSPDTRHIVMPSVYCQGDTVWIQEQLQKFTASSQHKIVALYADVYQAAFDEEPVSYKQENAGRKAANTRLRLFVSSHARSAAGLTEKPPLASDTAQTEHAE